MRRKTKCAAESHNEAFTAQPGDATSLPTEGSEVPPRWEGDINDYCQSWPVGNLTIIVHFEENKSTPTLFRLQQSRAGGLATAACQLIITPFFSPSPGGLFNQPLRRNPGCLSIKPRGLGRKLLGAGVGRRFCKGRAYLGGPRRLTLGQHAWTSAVVSMHISRR